MLPFSSSLETRIRHFHAESIGSHEHYRLVEESIISAEQCARDLFFAAYQVKCFISLALDDVHTKRGNGVPLLQGDSDRAHVGVRFDAHFDVHYVVVNCLPEMEPNVGQTQGTGIIFFTLLELL